MGSTFSSLNAGLTGLYAAQRLIEVSGQNIINQNTPGYTRQRVEQKALGIGSEPSIFSGSVPQGGGVEITGERRLDDFFLDTKLRMETGRAALTKETSSAWKNIESSMDELGRMSLSNSLRSFYKSWGDVNNSSDNLGARATAIGAGRALVDQIRTGYTHINDLWKNGRAELDALVSDLNTTMNSVLALNERIRKAVAVGTNVNHLIDERDKLALHISELTGATVRKGYSIRNDPAGGQGSYYEDGSIEIMLAGNSMVGKNYVNHFKVDGSRDMPGIDAAPRKVYQKAVEALGNNAAGKSRLEETFEFHGHKIQKYQAFVGAYKKDDKYYEGGKEQTVGDNDKLIGKKYVAFYDVETVMKEKAVKGDKPNEAPTPIPEKAVQAKTRQGFSDRDFISDEGPVRLTWTVGGHNVAIEEGRIGGLVRNLRPAEIPGVSGTIGRGGCWAETGKLYNDAAANIAHEVNLFHANNLKEVGKKNGNYIIDKDGTVKDVGKGKGNYIVEPEGEVPNNTKSLVTKSTTFKVISSQYQNEPEEVEEGNPAKKILNPKIPPVGLATLTQKEGETAAAFENRKASLTNELKGILNNNNYKVAPGTERPVAATVQLGFKPTKTSIEVPFIPKPTNPGPNDVYDNNVEDYKKRVEQERVKLDKALEGTGWKVKSVKYPLGTAVVQLEQDPKASQPALKVSVSIQKGETEQKFKERVNQVLTHTPALGTEEKKGLQETLEEKLNNTILRNNFDINATPGTAGKPEPKIDYRNEVSFVIKKANGAELTKDDEADLIKAIQSPLERKDFGSDADYNVAVQQKVHDLEQLYPGSSVTFTNEKEDGGDFFEFAAADNKLPPALRLGVAIDDPMKIAAGVYKNGVYDGSVALRIGNQQDEETSTLNEWSKSVVDIGVHSAGAKDRYTLAEQTRAVADQQQKSQSSVDMNEEVMNLIRGQHAYAGAARITSTVNAMLETLINLGR